MIEKKRDVELRERFNMSKENNGFAKEIARPHTVKKFDLIEAYTKEWALKLLNYGKCEGVVFIDCMCNNGVYVSEQGEEIYGTPIRVARLLSEIMKNYPTKRALLLFNDLENCKIEELKTHLPQDTANFVIKTYSGDGNELLKEIDFTGSSLNYLLLYDPYDASIDWDALLPFLRNWGEVIINHMVLDSVRSVSQVKRKKAISKYEQTYLANIVDLVNFKNDKESFEKRIQDIIFTSREENDPKYYVSSFPFFNSKNSVVYNLIHCSGHIEGLKLIKKVVWKTFGGKSSAKDRRGMENQMTFDFDNPGALTATTDEYCYSVKDIAKYLQDLYKKEGEVSLSDIWNTLDEHPVFPSDGFKTQIKNEIKSIYGARIRQTSIIFIDKDDNQ